MTETDEWGKDPSVQVMRKVFKGMEMPSMNSETAGYYT